MRFTSLRTERLLIRPLVAQDVAAIARYRSQPEVKRYQSWDNYSEQKAQELITEMTFTKPDVKGKWFQFGIELASNKKLIGDIGFLNTDTLGKSWVGFTLDADFWNKGYATEAVSAVLTYYKELGIVDVWASTDPKNAASINLLKRLQFALIESKPGDLVFQKFYPAE